MSTILWKIQPDHQIKHQESAHQRIKNTNFTSKPNALIEIFPIHLLTFLLLSFTFNGLPLTVYRSLLTLHEQKKAAPISQMLPLTASRAPDNNIIKSLPETHA